MPVTATRLLKGQNPSVDCQAYPQISSVRRSPAFTPSLHSSPCFTHQTLLCEPVPPLRGRLTLQQNTPGSGASSTVPWREPNMTEDGCSCRASSIAFGDFSAAAIVSLNSASTASIHREPPQVGDTGNGLSSTQTPTPLWQSGDHMAARTLLMLAGDSLIAQSISPRIDSITTNNISMPRWPPTHSGAEPLTLTPESRERETRTSDGDDSRPSYVSRNASTTLVEEDVTARSREGSSLPLSSTFPTLNSPCVTLDISQRQPVDSQIL